MGVCLDNATLTKSRIDNKPNIYIAESKKNNDEDKISNGSQSLIKSIKNKIENENKHSIKSENKIIDANDKNKFRKTEDNNDNSSNTKIFVKSQYILKKILLHLVEKKKLLLIKY